MKFCSVCLQLSHGIYIYYYILVDSDDAGPWTILSEALVQSLPIQSVWETYYKLSIQSQLFGISEFPSQGELLDLPILSEEPVLCAVTKAQEKNPTLAVSLDTTWVVVLAKGNNKKWISENIQVMSRALGRGLLRNIFSLRVILCSALKTILLSQDKLLLLFPVHECLVYILDGFLLQIWQQERQYGQTGLRLDRKQRDLSFRVISTIYSVTSCK